MERRRRRCAGRQGRRPSCLAGAGVDREIGQLFQLLNEHLRVQAALVVLLAAGGRKVIGSAFEEAAFGLEIGERLRRERDQLVEAHFAGLVLDELYKLAADALVFVSWADIQT